MPKSLEILQPRTSLEMGLTCSICQDIFTDPHLLPCGHTFCKTCLLDMLEHISEMGFRCPDCRASFGPFIRLQKNFAVASIAEDLRKVQPTQQGKNKPAYCDCCISGGRATALKTCLTCMVSMCEEHIVPHLELPAFREHNLTEPLRDLRTMKCPQHEVYKRYCSASRKYVCRWCDIEAKSTNETTKKLNTMNKDLMEFVKQKFQFLEGKLDCCVATVQRLQNIISSNAKRPAQKNVGGWALGSLLVVIILVYLVHSTSKEIEDVNSSLRKQDTLLAKIYSRLNIHSTSKETEDVNSSLRKQHTLLAKIYSRLNKNALDPNSASPLLRISDDLMSVERQNDRLPVAPHPYRFDKSPQVLTTQCVFTGVHYWEVEAEGYWDIAMSYSTIERKDKTRSTFGMNSKSWSLTQNKKKQLLAFHNGVKAELHNKVLSHNRVIIAVNYEEGVIVFWDAMKLQQPLYSFIEEFTEPICLGFGLYLMDPPTRISIISTYP